MPRPTGTKSNRQDVEFDLAFPPTTIPAPSVLADVGEAGLRDLVRRHHELLRQSSIGDLFPADPKHFAFVVEKISTFIIETIGGSPQLAQTHGPNWFRARHLALTIDETARNVWLGALLASFEDVGFPEQARLEYWNWVEALSIRAITRRTMIGQPRRYPFKEAPTTLGPFIPQ
jgi:hemoglobin